MGWGVTDGATFESLVETRLNEEFRAEPYRRFELLNFGVPGYQPPQQLIAWERAREFRPTSVFYVAAGREQDRSAMYMAEVVRKGIEIPYPELRDIVMRSGVQADMDEAAATRALTPYGSEILRFVYEHIATKARERGIVPVWIFLPQVREGSWMEATPEAVRIAQD